MDSDAEDIEPTILEYARFHGLTLDYLLEPLITARDIPLPSSEITENEYTDILDGLPTDLVDELTKERIAITPEAALLLRSVQSLQGSPSNLQHTTKCLKSTRKLKLELPILQTDHELDLIAFGNTALPSFNDLHIPYEHVSTERDESLEWPRDYFLYPERCKKEAKSEKLAVSKDALVVLQNAIKDDWTHKNGAEARSSAESTSKRILVWRPLTPPLLPLSPPLTPYVPSSPGNCLRLLSDGSDSVVAELEALEWNTIKLDATLEQDAHMETDPMLFDGEDLANFDRPKHSLIDLPALKRKADNLRIEGPLTPPILPQSPLRKLKSVTFTEQLHEFIPVVPSMSEIGNDLTHDDDGSMSILKDIEPMVKEVNNAIENEKLSEVDTTRRVRVPHIHPFLPLAPWDEFRSKRSSNRPSTELELQSQTEFILEIKREHFKSAASWHGLSKLERNLIWNPFQSRPSSITVDEHLKDDGDVLAKLGSYLRDSDMTTSSNYTWKHEGLLILEEDEVEEELEAGEFEESNDMETLILKRKLQIDEEEADTVAAHKSAHFSPRLTAQIAATNKRVKTTDRGKAIGPPQDRRNSPASKTVRTEDDDSSLMFGGVFSATNALHKFMQIHGQSTERNEQDGSKLPRPQNAPTTKQSLPYTELSACRGNEKTCVQLKDNDRSESSVMAPPLLPQLPDVPSKLPSSDCMISTVLLQQPHRSLMREIERLNPEAIFTERDFGTVHPPTSEADVLLSPSTGLIFTTLQLIKQRALPGKANRSPIKERITSLQLRYERLIVLISEGLSRELEEAGTGRLTDSRDTEALMELTSFASRMDAEVTVKYVQGGEMALARIIVQEMAKWGLPHGSKDISDLKLLHEETIWELFLRRAGLNPFASQAILASLKTPYDLQPYSSSPTTSQHSVKPMPTVFGLTALIMMSPEDRIKRFQVLLGGSRVLGQVNNLLSQEWPSAVHDFAI